MGNQTLTLAQSGTIDEGIQSVFGPFVDVLEKIVFFAVPIGDSQLPVVVVWLLLGGIFCSFFLGFRPWRDLKQTLRVVRGMMARKSDPGEVTSFQAFATELAGTVGLGNIAGVAVAITLGGPGAALWIIIAGFLGMAVKAAEATLGQMFRRINADGTISGGPMYYLSDGLASIGKPKTGRFLGLFYAIGFAFAAFGVGNVFQANQVAQYIVSSTGGTESFFADKGWLIGVFIAIPAAIVILGGIQSIATWTSRLVPAMSVLYTLAVIVILAAHIDMVPEAMKLILTEAFTPESVEGGAIGVMIIGIQRALFSNVAGVGTAGMAHSVAKNRRPTEEGLTAAWEPFVDSVFVCTLTALAIIVTGEYQNRGATGVDLATNAFETVDNSFSIILAVCIILFAFSTVLSYAYYGQKATGYVFKNSKKAELVYALIYVAMIVVGAAVSLDTVVRFSDASLFLVAIPNLLGIYLLSGVLRKEIKGYRNSVASGEIQPAPAEEQVKLLNRSQSKPQPEKVSTSV